MHPYYAGKGDPVEAPAPVQRAKNLVEEFFGLAVGDGLFLPAKAIGPHYSGGDCYECCLVSPTGRQLIEFTLTHRPDDGWVTIQFGKGVRQWQQALQVAIDNFVNSPEGGPQALGEWKPDPAKLLSAR